MPLRLFHSRNVVAANLVMALLVVGFFGMFFLGALYMQGLLGYSPLEVGLAFLPSSILMGILSLGYAEKLIMGVGPKVALIAGLSIAGLGLLLFARAPVDANYWTDVFPVMLLLGLGAGTCFPSLMTLAMSGATREDAGLASGLVNTTVQVGGAIGLAVIATVASEPHREPDRRRRPDRPGDQLRLPPGVPDRGDPDRRRRGDLRGRRRSEGAGRAWGRERHRAPGAGRRPVRHRRARLLRGLAGPDVGRG